nr:MAG TPA: hypothetical protein [Caudoviricetes sp.]
MRTSPLSRAAARDILRHGTARAVQGVVIDDPAVGNPLCNLLRVDCHMSREGGFIAAKVGGYVVGQSHYSAIISSVTLNWSTVYWSDGVPSQSTTLAFQLSPPCTTPNVSPFTSNQ